jgi:hypothetical protein
MARHPRDILSEYGPEHHSPQQPRITKNGPAGSLHSDTDYHPPQGPLRQFNPGPGLRGGVNYGVCGLQGPTGGKEVVHHSSGSPSSGGHTRREGGAQGRR